MDDEPLNTFGKQESPEDTWECVSGQDEPEDTNLTLEEITQVGDTESLSSTLNDHLQEIKYE